MRGNSYTSCREAIVKTVTRPINLIPPPDEEGAWDLDSAEAGDE